MSSLSPLLRGSKFCFSVTGCGGLPFQFLCGSWGFPFYCCFLTFLLFVLFMYILFICIMRVLA